MPLKLIPPKAGRSPNYKVRGTYLGVYVDRSTGSGDGAFAKKFRSAIKRDIESGALTNEKSDGFAAAAHAYMIAGGERAYVAPLLKHFGDVPLPIAQADIDNAAAVIYPDATAATRNRQVYTPISAIHKRAGYNDAIKRPKGWRGRKLTTWLTPERAFAVFNATAEIEAPENTKTEFRILLKVLCYTGMRLSDALYTLCCENVDLDRREALLPRTKNDEPRLVYLPMVVVDELRLLPAGLNRRGRVFRFHKGGYLRDLFKATLKVANVVLPPRVFFHVFCHTWATWMRQYGGLDTYDLVDTDRWSDPDSADRYAHVVMSEQSKKADLLPVDTSIRAKAG